MVFGLFSLIPSTLSICTVLLYTAHCIPLLRTCTRPAAVLPVEDEDNQHEGEDDLFVRWSRGTVQYRKIIGPQ